MPGFTNVHSLHGLLVRFEREEREAEWNEGKERMKFLVDEKNFSVRNLEMVKRMEKRHNS